MQVPSWMPVIFYAVVIMLFIGIYSLQRIENETEQKPFSNMVFLTAGILINDFISRLYIYDGFPHWLIVATTYANFGLLTIVGVFWYRLVRSVLSLEERTRALRLDVVIYALSGIGVLALVINPVAGTIFSFDAMGNYHRGFAFFVPAGATFLCIVVSEIFLSFRVRSLGSSVFISLLVFPLPPLIGGVVAMFFYGIPWMPLGISLSMLILFTTLHTTSLGKDFLTGLSNRKHFDELFDERVLWAQHGRRLAAILVDLDDFKKINDTLGHNIGDIALAKAARILRECVRANDELARIGGDEFMILVDRANEATVKDIMARIEREVENHNKHETKFKLALSMGYAFYDEEVYTSPEEFLNHVDELMYTNKQQRKATRQLATAS